MSTFFIIEALGGKTADKKLLPLLLLAGAKSESLQTIMLMRAFGEVVRLEICSVLLPRSRNERHSVVVAATLGPSSRGF